jgi:hypothetical protein
MLLHFYSNKNTQKKYGRMSVKKKIKKKGFSLALKAALLFDNPNEKKKSAFMYKSSCQAWEKNRTLKLESDVLFSFRPKKDHTS